MSDSEVKLGALSACAASAVRARYKYRQRAHGSRWRCACVGEWAMDQSIDHRSISTWRLVRSALLIILGGYIVDMAMYHNMHAAHIIVTN